MGTTIPTASRARLRWGLLALLAILSACGGSPTATAPSTARLYLVHALPSDYLAYTSWRADSAETTVEVLRGLTYDEQVAIVAHELFHVAGFSSHLSDPSCAASGWEPRTFPCDEELALMRSVARTFVLSPEPDLLAATVQAARFWNEPLGFAMFEVP